MSNKIDKHHEAISKFDGFTETLTEIFCTKCKKSEYIDGDQYDTFDYFYEKGWRATERNCYCPTCRKKYKIKK